MKKTGITKTEFPLGRQFGRLTKLYFGALTKRLEHLHLDKHFSLILFVSETQNCTQQFLCDKMKMDKASMVRVIDQLSKKKYLRREVNPEDRREMFIRLTEKAKKELPQIQKAISGLNKSALKGLTKKDSETFYENLCIVYKNLGSEPADEIIMHYKKSKRKK